MGTSSGHQTSKSVGWSCGLNCPKGGVTLDGVNKSLLRERDPYSWAWNAPGVTAWRQLIKLHVTDNHYLSDSYQVRKKQSVKDVNEVKLHDFIQVTPANAIRRYPDVYPHNTERSAPGSRKTQKVNRQPTHVMFGWVPPLLHIHHFNIQNCAKLHFGNQTPRRVE